MSGFFLKRGVFFTLVLLILLAAPATGVAQGEQPPISDDEVNTVAKGLYCPVCENIPLDVCGTQACAQWRELIREKLGQGWSDDEIKLYFVEQYGDRVLAEPPARGINWLVYLVPPFAFLLGVFILVRALRSYKTSGEVAPETAETIKSEAPKDDYIARLEEELRRSG
jgi:cytochrome c-type biogenesis protein CcmH